MSTGTPNYRFGIRNGRIALQTAAGTYGTPWAERGAQSVAENSADNSVTTFYSDDDHSANVAGAAGNSTLNVQFSEFSDDFMTKCLGHRTDATKGGVIKGYDDEQVVFAFGYEVQGTTKRSRTWKYGCTTSEPTATFQSRQGSGVTESPQSCTFTVGGDTFADGNDGTYSEYEWTVHEGDPGFETFLDTVPIPPAAA